jgi:hypothetical protein
VRRAALLAAAAALSALALSAPAAHAASYRGADLQRALVRAFEHGHGGSPATARCTSVRSDTKWRCRLQRKTKARSSAFTATIGAGGRWKAGAFAFTGFSARYHLTGCCLRRR